MHCRAKVVGFGEFQVQAECLEGFVRKREGRSVQFISKSNPFAVPVCSHHNALKSLSEYQCSYNGPPLLGPKCSSLDPCQPKILRFDAGLVN